MKNYMKKKATLLSVRIYLYKIPVEFSRNRGKLIHNVLVGCCQLELVEIPVDRRRVGELAVERGARVTMSDHGTCERADI